MDQAARVLEQCAASPGDDAPRLVWADLVGGERGELVVIQCDLARGDLPPREIAKRRKRERELLELHGVAWAGELATIAKRWAFRRGFVESALLDTAAFDAGKLAHHPLLASFVFGDSRNIERIVRAVRVVRGLALSHDEELAKLALPDLRAFSIEHFPSERWFELRDFIAAAPIEQLRFPHHDFDVGQFEGILEAAPSLAALETMGTWDGLAPAPLAAPLLRRSLRALRTSWLTWHELDVLAGRSTDTLEHLQFQLGGEVERAIEVLGSFRALATLEIAGPIDALASALAASSRFERLRALRVQTAIAPRSLATLAERFGPQLELLEVPTGTHVDDITRARVAGEVHERVLYERFVSPLVHHEPTTMFTLAPACFAKTQAACVARLDTQGPIWDLPPMPVEQRLYIGRSVESTVRVNSPMVARRHAMLVWEDGRYVLRDLQSANGTYVGDRQIDAAELGDGSEFRVGDVILQYFSGAGARTRADEAVAATRGIEPNTRLPRHDSPPFRVSAPAWQTLVGTHGSWINSFVMRELAQQIERDIRGEKLWFVRPGTFGVETHAIATSVARPRRVDLGSVTLEIELVVDPT